MKQFAAVALAAFIGVLAALIAYYLLVAKPEVRRELDRVEEVRAEAREVGQELERAAERSVAAARAGFDAQALEESRRRMLVSALAAAQGARVAVTEAAMTNGKLPASNEEAGLPAAESFADPSIASLAVGDGGVVTLRTSEALSGGGQLFLMPALDTNTYRITWRCESTGIADIARLVRECEPRDKATAVAR